MAILYSYPLSPLIHADDLIPGTLEDSKTTVNWKVSTLATYISNTQDVSTNRIPKYDGSKFVNSPFLVSNATTVKTEADIWFPTRGIKDTDDNIGITGQVLSSFNGGLKWIAPGGGYFLDVPTGTTNITLNDATGQTTDVELSATGNISLTRIDANNIQIGSTPINKATSTVLGTVKLNSDTVQAINAQIVSADLNRTYGLQFNSQDQGVINVPWVDTQYAVFTGATAGSDGSTGLVPQPLQGEELKFLRADATWADNPGITYTLTGVTVNTTDFNINLNPSPGTTESVTLKPGTNVTLTGGTNEVTINAVDQFDGTVTSITPAADSGTGTAITTVGTLTFTGSGDITTSVSGDTVTIGYTDTPYVLPVATSSALGGIKIGYTQNAKNYPVVLSSEQAYVNVPWTDNNDNTTYILGKAAGSTDLILKADGTAQDTITFSGTANEVTVTGALEDAYIFGLPDDVTVAGELTVSGTGQSSFSGQVTVLATPSASTDAASKGYVDGLVSGGLTFRGTFRADTGEIVSGVNNGSFLYNCPGGAGTRVAVAVGDYYIVATAGGQFYCSGTNLDIGDSIIATASAAADASVVAGWSIVQSDEGVTDFSSTKGTYIDITNNANAVGSVDIGTVDLNAIDGTSDTNTRFLSKDNTWDVPSYTTDNDTTYTVDVPSATTSINLAGSDGTNDAIVLTGGTNVTLSRTDASTIDIASINTEYVAMTSTVLGLGKLFDDTEQTVGATAVSAITARTYGVQMNSSDQLVVNVPWTNTQNAFQTITGTGSNNTDSGILLSDSGGTVKILGAGNVTAAQSGNTITLTGTGSDTTYTYTSAQSTNDVDLILTDSNSATNIVKLVKGSNITLTDSSNSVTIAAQNDNDNDFLTGLAFNTGDGVLTATVQNQNNVTVDLDGRYALSSGSVSGGGTSQKVVKFTNTSSTAATIGDGPITFSSNDSAFAGNLSAGVGSFQSPDASESVVMNLSANNGNNAATFRTTASGHIFEIRSQNSGTIKIDSSSTTFAGSVSIDANSGILTQEILKVKGGGSGGAYGFLVEANNGDDLFKVDTSTYNCYFPSSFTKVGIGTDSPATKLDLGSTQAGGMQFLYDTTQAYRHQILNYWNSGTDSRMDFNIGRTANVAPVTVMSVGYDGNVGIATTTPNGKLDIQYDMDVDTGSITGLTAGTLQYGNINFSGVATQTSGAAGTTMQGLTWQVNNYAGTTDYGVQAQLVVGNNGSVGTFMGFFTSDNYSAAPNERLRITSSGVVAINQAAANIVNLTPLQVESAGDVSLNDGIAVKRSGTSQQGYINMQSGIFNMVAYDNTPIKFRVGSAGQTTAAQIDTDGSLVFSQYGSGNITGTAAYNLSVDSSGNVIETVNAAANPPVLEQTWTFTRAELLAGFGGSGTILIAGQGAATFVVITDSWWKTKGTGTSNNGWTMQVRQANQIPGVQTVSLINGTQWNYMTNANAGNGMFYRDTPAGGAAGRPYEENQQTTLHIASSSGSLGTGFTSLSVKLQYRIFDNNF